MPTPLVHLKIKLAAINGKMRCISMISRKNRGLWIGYGDESTCFPLLWPEFKSHCLHHMWAKFVVNFSSLLRVLRFSPLLKNQDFQSPIGHLHVDILLLSNPVNTGTEGATESVHINGCLYWASWIKREFKGFFSQGQSKLSVIITCSVWLYYDQNSSRFSFLCKLGLLLFKPRWDCQI